METRTNNITRKVILGILLVLFGFLLLSEELGWIGLPIHNVIFSWQMIFIVIGVLTLSHRGNNVPGIILVTIGVFFLLPRLFDFTVDMHKLFWSLVFLSIGIVILFHKKKDHSHWHRRWRSEWHSHRLHNHKWETDWSHNSNWEQEKEESSSDYIDEVNVFKGGERKITSKSFRGGKIVSIFGGSNYDLLDCELAEGKNVLEMVNIFGGSKLIVPSDWIIQLDVVAIFGGFIDKRRRISQPSETSGKKLYITGVAIFGGGEIKSI